jgi:glycolate oxidase FAD binding subunit
MDAALAMRKKILSSPLQPLTLEILSPALAQIFHRQAPTTLGETLAEPGTWLATKEWTLAAGFGGNERVIERHAADLTRLASESHASGAAILDDTSRPLLWGRLRECFPMLLEASPLATIFKISAPGTQFGPLLTSLSELAGRSGLPFVALVRSAGLVYLALLPTKSGADNLRALEDAATRVFKKASAHAEHVTIPWSPTELKRRVNVWGPPRGDFALMKKMKQTFDPHNILNPGRYVGGL